MDPDELDELVQDIDGPRITRRNPFFIDEFQPNTLRGIREPRQDESAKKLLIFNVDNGKRHIRPQDYQHNQTDDSIIARGMLDSHYIRSYNPNSMINGDIEEEALDV